MRTVNLHVVKASVTPDGVRRFSAVASDTGTDLEQQQTTLDLFRDWIERCEKSIAVPFLPPPKMPYLGVAHYRELGGAGVAGVATKMYIDGNRLKVSGVFSENELGDALFRALSAEKSRANSDKPEIRISAGWFDLSHRHPNGYTFVAKSASDVCPECAAHGDAGIVYLKGQLEHLAATRVPVNPRTELELEMKSMDIKTIRDDAASIVGDELADKLEEKKASTTRGKSLVTKSDGDGESPAAEASAPDDKPAAYDNVTCPECGALLDDVHEGDECPQCGHKFTADDLVQPPAGDGDDRSVPKSLAFGGAKSIDRARAFALRNMEKSLTFDAPSNWQLLYGVLDNVLSEDKVPAAARIARAQNVIEQFGDELAAMKSAADNMYLMYRDSREPNDKPSGNDDASPGDDNDEYNDVAAYLSKEVGDALKDGNMTRDEKLKKIQAALDVFADVVRRQVDEVPVDEQNTTEAVNQAVKAAVAPLMDEIAALTKKINELSAAGDASSGTNTRNQWENRPRGKSIQYSEVVPERPSPRKPMGIKDIARQSTGL